MKPKKKTILALALAAALALTAFTACGNGSPSGAQSAPAQGAGMDTPPGMSGGPGGSSADIEYTASTEINNAETQENQTYASSAADESALLIATADSVTIANPTITKSGDSDGGDNCNFYGLNAAVLVKDGANVTITGGTVRSDASGANGVFCYGGNGGQNGASGDGTTLDLPNGVTGGYTGDVVWGDKVLTFRGGVLKGVADND